MSDNSFTRAVKYIVEPYPKIRSVVKKIYQVTGYLLSDRKTTSVGDLTRITPSDEYEYFYGYYDKSPWDAEDRLVLAMKAKRTNRDVAPSGLLSICIIDTDNNNSVKVIAKSSAWNVQQGCMAQWLGPDYKTRIIYNDFRNGKFCSVILNIKTMTEEHIYDRPIYDVSKDGEYALSLDFCRLHRLRPGYGYSNILDETNKIACPDSTCIWMINLKTREIKELIKYTDLLNFETDPTMIGAEHKVNHIMLRPDGRRFMFLHRWYKRGRKYTRLLTMNIDGTDLFNLSSDGFVSHCFWKNNSEVISFLKKKELGKHYYLLRDKSDGYRLLWPSLERDGHCSYSFDGKVVTDTYPDKRRMATVYVCDDVYGKIIVVAKVFSPFRYDNDCRCDLHPRWNHMGDKICIDSAHEGKREMYLINIKGDRQK